MKLAVLLILLVITAVVISSAVGNVIVQEEIGRDVILPPLNFKDDKSLPEVCLIFAQGADIKPEQYKSLAREIQKQSVLSFKLWVGIPEFLGDYAEPLVLDHGINRVISKLQKLGMSSDAALVTAGHSLGGAMIQLWTNKNADKVKAQVLMGAFLTRSWKKDYVFQYSVPTLTIGGELDGLARITRMAEAYYTQIEDPTQDHSANRYLYPVTAITGLTHMQFAEGDIPSMVFNRDLIPEISYDDAHTAVAKDVITYLKVRLLNDLTAKRTLTNRLDDSYSTFFSPILDSLHLEGYHNFRPPCLCPTDICETQTNCTAYCPFTQQYSQNIMAGSDIQSQGVAVNNRDSFHDVWETEPTVHLPTVTSCDAPSGCSLSTTTITQGVYHTGEDLEIWKKHFDVPELDSGFLPISARELRTKMTSRQSIYYHAGVTDASFDELDGQHDRCAEINQYSWDWAIDRLKTVSLQAKVFSSASSVTYSRFEKYGQPYVMGPDEDTCPAGPCWIWDELDFTTSADHSNVVVSSIQFPTPVDFPLPKTRGFHYCKVLSPARSMEWIFVDGLRDKYSLKSQGR